MRDQILFDHEHDAMVDLFNDCWIDNRPDNPDQITPEWDATFIETFSSIIQEHYEVLFDIDKQHSTMLALSGFYEIDWKSIATKISQDKLPALVRELEQEYERQQAENGLYFNDDCDRAYDSYVDGRLDEKFQ